MLEEIPTPEVLPEVAPSMFPYEVEGVGVVEAHDGATYVVRVASGAVYGYASPSGTPSPELAAEEIAYAIAHPPAFAPSVPTEVSRRQLWLALNAMGVTRAAVKAQLAGNELALIDLEEATVYRRDNPLVAMLGASLGLNSAQIDGIFISAAAL